MCIIVDVNTFSSVFDKNSLDHIHFSPVEDHIKKGKSKLIVGGTKFLAELKYRSLLAELNRANKIVVANKEEVDSLQLEIESRVKGIDNDHHIIALSCVARAKVVCTKDSNLQKYLRNREFYNRGMDRPKMFNSKSPSTVLPAGPFKKTCLLCR